MSSLHLFAIYGLYLLITRQAKLSTFILCKSIKKIKCNFFFRIVNDKNIYNFSIFLWYVWWYGNNMWSSSLMGPSCISCKLQNENNLVHCKLNSIPKFNLWLGEYFFFVQKSEFIFLSNILIFFQMIFFFTF